MIMNDFVKDTSVKVYLTLIEHPEIHQIPTVELLKPGYARDNLAHLAVSLAVSLDKAITDCTSINKNL